MKEAVIEILRKFIADATSLKLNEKRLIYDDLLLAIKNKEISEQIIGDLLKLIVPVAVFRFQTPTLRRLVRSLIINLSEEYKNETLVGLAKATNNLFGNYKQSSPSLAKSVLSVWKWIIAVCDRSETIDTSAVRILTDSLTLCSYLIFTAGNQNTKNCALKKLYQLLRKKPYFADKFAECSIQGDNARNVCLFHILFKFWKESNNADSINKYFEPAIEFYIKLVLSSKAKTDRSLLVLYQPLFCLFTHDKFQQLLLTHIQKYLLRNPEYIIEAVGIIFSQVSIDLSQYASELCKPLAVQLFAKEIAFQEEAAASIKSLGLQCSDLAVCEKLLIYLFSVLNGSEGKLSNAAQSIGVINGIRSLSYNAVSGAKSINALSLVAVDSFIVLLKEEVHEGTLQAALTTLTSWASKFVSEFPEKLTIWFKESLNLKSSTAPVRLAYLSSMNNVYNGDNVIFAQPLLPVMLGIVEKAAKQSSQIPLVLEALPACLLILKLVHVVTESDSKLKSFWSWIIEKKLFFNDKVFQVLDKDQFLIIVDIVQRLLLENSDKLNESESQQFYYMLLYSLLHSSHTVRSKGANLCKKLLSTLSGGSLSNSLLKTLKEILLTSSFEKIFEDQLKAQLKDDSAVKDITTHLTCGKVFCEALLSVSKVPDAEESVKNKICLSALPLSCHNRLHVYDPSIWLKLLKFYNIDPHEFTTKYRNELIDLIWASETNLAYDACKFLGLVGSDEFYNCLLTKCWKTVDVNSLNGVTVEDVLVMKTPEGELFDKSVLISAKDDEKLTNIKRESKAYSYKEQMAALALQKELEEKKRKEGKLKNELTPKQKEAVAQQLIKESILRKQLTELWNPAQKSLLLVKALIAGNKETSQSSIVELQSHFWPLLKSPLAAPVVVDCLLELRNACFLETKLLSIATAVMYAYLRLVKASCDLDNAWCQESSVNQAKRSLQFLIKNIHPIVRQVSDAGEGLTSESASCQPLSSACFSFCFPLINTILLERAINFKNDSDFLTQAIDFCNSHIGKNAWNCSIDTKFDVSSLPLVNITILMLKIVGTTNVGNLQQASCNCLVDTCGTVCRFSNKLPKNVTIDVAQIVMNEMLHSNDLVREYCLRGMKQLTSWFNNNKNLSDIRTLTAKRLWVAKFDTAEENQIIADKLWEELKCETGENLCELLLIDVVHHCQNIRESASDAALKCLEIHPKALSSVLNQLSVLYVQKLEMSPPIYDDFGRLITEGDVDQWESRAGVALTLRKLCPLLTSKDLTLFFNILIPDGLNDRSTEVSHLMLLAAVEGVKIHGKEQISKLLPLFEKQLDELPDERKFDKLRQSVIVLLGTLAQHLEKDDIRIKPIVGKLIEALSTPAQLVQQAVANCLPPLVPAIKEQVPQMVEKLLCLLLEANQYGERRGAAYGLAGLVKGMGILSLRQLDIMTKLSDAMVDKKVARHREGALLALEMLCNMLGKLFEPYVVHVLPNLLLSFGDTDQHVREAADECAKAVMRHLSAHGVKLVLPALLTALEEDSWRTKCGSVELLGAMAYCAPKQLSSCLPNIVPKIIEVLSDTHIRVQKAGEQALKHIGQVIKNPEIQAIVNILLDALEDPAKKTASCLQVLLHTKFVHYIDAPSLSLIMPVVHRAFDDRSTETRRSAAQIVGNIYSLTDQRDVEPYLPQIMPGLKKCLLDPVPEVRGVAAKALGTMVAATGEANFQDLLPWLQQMLTSPNSSVDRSGAAQGLSEVIGGLGEGHLQRIMPDIIQTAGSADVEPCVRDGYLMMFIYLPAVFGERFLPYLSKIIPSVLTSLADESEFVRETALRSGQRMINMYCENAIPLLLPSLERGLFDDNWRIRFSSVQLLGDLLYKISGVTGKMTTESGEDDTFGTEQSSKSILSALGLEKRNRVLSGLYISRSDVALMVRQAAGHVWKVIVSNTPKTLKEILPTLFQLLLGCLASANYDKQQVAARSLGELVKKMGERILVDVVPVLENGLKSAHADQRQGVCIALSEIMSNTSKETILMYSDNLIPSVRSALCDPLHDVRVAAAQTFSVLHSTIGPQAMDDVLTPLLSQLDDETIGSFVLDGLQQVMALKSRVVLPYMVPKLTTAPINTKALSHLASVAGDSLNKHLHKVLSALISSFALKINTDQQNEELHNCSVVLVSVKDEIGVPIVMEMLLPKNYEDENTKIACALLLAYFCQHAKVSLTQYVPQLIRGCLNLYLSENDIVLGAATEALSSLVKSLDAKEQMDQASCFRQAIKASSSSIKSGCLLPGFCRDKAVLPVLTVFREGVLNGGVDMKELAANGLNEVIVLSDSAALKPHVVNVTGPLIRVLGDRYPPNVKSAVLASLALLLEKVGIVLKPFLPQLQSTFLKALNEPASRSVRLKAAKALSQLMSIHTKADTVIADLCKNVNSADDTGIKETYLIALRLSLQPSHEKLTTEMKSLVESTTIALLSFHDDSVRIAAGAALGTFVGFCSKPGTFENAVKTYLLDCDLSADWQIRHSSSVALQVALKINGELFASRNYEERLLKTLSSNITADRVAICTAGLRATGYYFSYQLKSGVALDSQLASVLGRSVNHQSNDVKQLCGDVLDWLGRKFILDNNSLKIFVPSMVNGTKEKNSAVRCACEQALISMLRLRQNMDVYQNFLNSLDVGFRDSLSDVYSKSLQKLAKQAEPACIELDDTVQA